MSAVIWKRRGDQPLRGATLPRPYRDEDTPRAAMLLTAFPALAAQFKPVPDGYYHHDGRAATIACVCGRRPVVQRGELVSCEAARCWIPGVRSECGRSFIATNRGVLAFRPAA